MIREKISYKKALRIYESLLREAVSLGVIKSGNMLEGLETDLKISKILNNLN